MRRMWATIIIAVMVSGLVGCISDPVEEKELYTEEILAEINAQLTKLFAHGEDYLMLVQTDNPRRDKLITEMRNGKNHTKQLTKEGHTELAEVLEHLSLAGDNFAMYSTGDGSKYYTQGVGYFKAAQQLYSEIE